MSNEIIPTNIEIIRNKLKKYTHLKEHRKVKEYLRRLRNLSLTCSLIQETKLDRLVRKLASNKTASYSSTARHLLQKWHHKKLLLPRSKPQQILPQLTTDITNSIEIKRENDNLFVNSNHVESQSTDDNKKRKVLSLAEYLETKKHVLSPSSTVNSNQNQLTDTQIQVINAQFQATTKKLTANAYDLANVVNKTLIQTEKSSSHQHIHSRTHSNSIQINSQQSKVTDLWNEEDEDDEDDDDCSTNIQSLVSQTRTVNNHFHTQKVQ